MARRPTSRRTTGSIEGCDAARAPVLTALRPFVRERVCARGARGSVPHRHPRAGRASGSANCERNRPGPGSRGPRALANTVVSDPGSCERKFVIPARNAGTATDTATACGLGTIGSSVIVVAILSRAGVHRTRHAESHNRAKRARLTGHRVPASSGRGFRPFSADTQTSTIRHTHTRPVIRIISDHLVQASIAHIL